MELKGDIPLKGVAWDTAITNYSGIFEPRTQYMLFVLSLALGIMYDKRIATPEGSHDSLVDIVEGAFGDPQEEHEDKDAHGFVFFCFHLAHGLEFFFQAAILSTTTVEMSEDERLELAFGTDTEYRKIDLLVEFANFGVTKILEQVGSTQLETMENLKNFLIATVEGRNFDIDALSDEDLGFMDDDNEQF